MAKRRHIDELPVAISTQAGLLAALLVLLMGALGGSRAWIVLMRAGIAFLLVAGILKLLTAAVLQAVRWKAGSEEKPRSSSDDIEETADLISSQAYSPETTEKVAS